jgi:hypothetical protein
MFAAARPRNIDLRPHREDGYRTACRTQRGIYQVERFFALLTDQHLRRAYFCKPDIASNLCISEPEFAQTLSSGGEAEHTHLA